MRKTEKSVPTSFQLLSANDYNKEEKSEQFHFKWLELGKCSTKKVNQKELQIVFYE